MVKHFTRFASYSITVLLTKLVYDTVVFFLPIIHSTNNPYLDVLIGMGITLILFYPMYGIFHEYSEKAVDHYVKGSKKVHKNRLVGILIGYVLGMALIFTAFLYIKFKINVFALLQERISSF